MSTNLTNASITAGSGATQTRTLAAYLSDIINVKNYGATGDGTTDDTAAIQSAITAAFGSTGSPHGSSGQYTNKTLYFPAGDYRISSPLKFRSIQGGVVAGAGIQTTRIFNNTSTSTVMQTNGCSYTCFRDLAVQVNGSSGSGSIGFDLDWDGTGTVALNANYFENMAFTGEIGINIGAGGTMGSENVFVNCYFTNCAAQGLVTRNFNALDQTIIGGGASGCVTGYKVLAGSIQLICNAAFANNSSYDIDIQSNCINAIVGCRSESLNFINAPAGTFSLVSCQHSVNTAGAKFVDNLNGSCVMTACQSDCSVISGNFGLLQLIGCDFNTFQGTITSASDNGAGLVRITTSTVLSALATGNKVVISEIVGTISSAANGNWTITKIDSTHIDLQGSAAGGSYTSGGRVTLSPTHHLANYSGYEATTMGRDTRFTSTSNFSIPKGFSNSQYDNIGATGTINYTLPNLSGTNLPYGPPFAQGHTYGFYVGSTATLQVTAAGGATIRKEGTVSVASGNVASNTVGNYIELTATSENTWVTKSVVGSTGWTVT